jgi:signal transduction histidine kinase
MPIANLQSRTILSRLLAAWLLLAVTAAPQTAIATPPPRAILIIDESDPSNGAPTTFSSTLRDSLNRVHPHIAVYGETLDLRQFSDSRQEAILRSYVQEKYRDVDLGLVITVGLSSLEFINRWRSEFWPGVPVVFAAIDEISAAQLKLDGDTTGLTMRRSIRSMVTAARHLVPKLQGIAVLGGVLERDPYRRHFLSELRGLVTELKVTNMTGLPLEEQVKQSAALTSNTAILYTSLFIDSLGTKYSSSDALAEIVKVANRPIVIDVEALMGIGATGGFVLDNVAYGKQAASLALRVLDGESAGSIPVAVSEFTRPAFDWRQLQRWGIGESQLPEGSDIRYRELRIWERHPQELAAISIVVLLQTTLIGWLFYEQRRRHLAEVQARDAMAELTYMNRRAAAGQLSASLTHEVNQPLAGIAMTASAALRLLSAETLDIDKIRGALTQIESSSHHAGDIINSVRAMFKKKAPERVSTDINQIILTVLSIVRVELQKHAVELQTQLSDHLRNVHADKVQLQQVVLNLVINGIEAMHSVRHRVLKVQTDQTDAGMVRVSIEDTGTGIDPSNLDRIFKPLFTTKGTGMGMGLSICQSIIQSHGGRIWVSQAINQGSIFQFELPVNAA